MTVFIKNKWKKILPILLIFCIVGGFYMVHNADAYVHVRGYYRKNGTYVRPYVRSNPNAFKFDNYGWTPSQGLYNKSYYAPTRNYSSDWYTPSYITDPYYYLGKSLYENGQSDLSSYTVPKTITPSYIPSYGRTVRGRTGIIMSTVPTTPKVIPTCGANEYLSTYNNKCYCNSGYKRNSAGVCEKVICGENEYLSTWNNKCYCNIGYKRNYSTGKCEKVICGANEYLSTYNNKCYCNSGYKRNYSTGQCEQIIIPPNAHLNEWSSQGWYCDDGYKQVGNTCQQIQVPANAHLNSWTSQGWYCDDGYKQVGNYCEKIIIPANAHLNSWLSQGWYCDTGYKQVGNSCQPE